MATEDSDSGCLFAILFICLFLTCSWVQTIEDRLDEIAPPPAEETTDDDHGQREQLQ